MEGMKIVIVGAGFTGRQLAKKLINERNEVVLIDNSEEVVRHASNSLDCDVKEMDGNNLENLEEVGIGKADALVCVTANDEVNMITCSLVDSVYPDILKIARVRNFSYYMNTAAAVKKHAEIGRTDEGDAPRHLDIQIGKNGSPAVLRKRYLYNVQNCTKIYNVLP